MHTNAICGQTLDIGMSVSLYKYNINIALGYARSMHILLKVIMEFSWELVTEHCSVCPIPPTDKNRIRHCFVKSSHVDTVLYIAHPAWSPYRNGTLQYSLPHLLGACATPSIFIELHKALKGCLGKLIFCVLHLSFKWLKMDENCGKGFDWQSH